MHNIYSKINAETEEKLNSLEVYDRGGILLYLPGSEIFIVAEFGGGSNDDSLEDGCDDYINIRELKFEDGEFVEVDGGQMDFCEEKEEYCGNIIHAVADVLNFCYAYIPEFIPLQTYPL